LDFCKFYENGNSPGCALDVSLLCGTLLDFFRHAEANPSRPGTGSIIPLSRRRMNTFFMEFSDWIADFQNFFCCPRLILGIMADSRARS
jgi:hypothetical protein